MPHPLPHPLPTSGVINFTPADGPTFGDTITSSPHLAGVSFTGSVRTFTHLWKQVAQNIHLFKTYPKMVGGACVCEDEDRVCEGEG